MFRTFFIGAAALSLAACATAPTPPSANIVETAVGAGQFNTLVAAVTAADLADTLSGPGPFTVFAPTDAAFAALPEGLVEDLLKPENKETLQSVLTYHVVPGKVLAGDLAGQTLSVATVQGAEVAIDGTDGVMVDQASVTTADVIATNGVIHVVDAVLLPPALRAAVATDDIVDVAAGAGQFNTLIAAVQAAGLEETLRSDGPFTVFAPTDAAFAKLDPNLVTTLLQPENKAQLVEILTYHVLPAAVTSDALAGKRLSAATVEGREVQVNGTGARVVVNGSIVTAADIPASNGVIHVVDTVLLPH